jgi:flagellar motor protein MotB
MAGKGGGAWKVAYADFVTAMMAFFLVMWLISQDTKVKESIAHYFANPIGWEMAGNSKNPGSSGNVFHTDFAGQVPGSRNRSVGQGIGDAAEPDFDETETQVVADWVLNDPAEQRRWTYVAERKLKWARSGHEERPGGSTPEALARHDLANEMRTAVTAAALGQPESLNRDLLISAFSKVDWHAIADECLQQVVVNKN